MPVCPKCERTVPSFEYYEAIDRQAFIQRCPDCRCELKTLPLSRYRQMAFSFRRDAFRTAVNAYFGEEVLKSTYYSIPSMAMTEACIGADFGRSPIIEAIEVTGIVFARLHFAGYEVLAAASVGAMPLHATGGAVFASNPVEAIHKAFFTIQREFNRDVTRVTMGRDAYYEFKCSQLREVMTPTEGSLTFAGVPISLRTTDEDTYRVDMHLEIGGHPAVESFEVLPMELPPTRA